MMGIYISGHPLDQYKSIMEKIPHVTTADVAAAQEEDEGAEVADGDNVTMIGVLTGRNDKTTRSGSSTVSYTHLDVYKRQALTGIEGFSEMVKLSAIVSVVNIVDIHKMSNIVQARTCQATKPIVLELLTYVLLLAIVSGIKFVLVKACGHKGRVLY